ncbi:MAG: hypothetical protein ACJAYU_003962 [Bradymonadia bacterium]|jgi:hypothetical protein
MEPWNTGNLEGLIPICGGIYFFLIANGTLPRNPRDPERMADWRKRFGRVGKVIAPLIVVHGCMQLAGVY